MHSEEKRAGCSVGTENIENQRTENIKTDVLKMRTEVIANVDYMLQAVGLSSYSLLQRSCAEATKLVLSITNTPNEPRTAIVRADLLRPQPSETISQWAVRYVEAMLSE